MNSLRFSTLFCLGVAWALGSASILPGLSGPAQAQSGSKNTARPIAPAVLSPGTVSLGEAYKIGPDDVLDVTVLRHPEFSATGLIVPGTGRISLPVVGGLQVAGKTVAQLDAEITRRLKVRLVRPEVDVSIAKPAPRPVYVVGQVSNPGVLEFKNGWHISEALAAAGGLSIDSDLAAVVVSRRKTTVADVPLLPILRDPSGTKNLELRVGDTLRFYERVVKVSIAGAVARPGAYSVPRGNGVVEAIGLAGGPTDSASLTRATLNHADGTVQKLNLYEALRQGNAAQNLPLAEGDVINVPEFKNRVSLLGSVKTPGYYSLEDGRAMQIADVIARAGGVSDGAALTRATLRRANGKVVPLNLYRLLVLGENTDNLALQADDVLTVPESRGIIVIGEVQRPGTYKIEEGLAPRASDALAQAGGLNIKPEQARISVSRTLDNGKNVTLNLDAVSLLELSSPSQNSLLKDGDIISVSAIKGTTIFVNGQVQHPGRYDLKEGDGLNGLIASAGGPTPDAALSRIAITGRDGQTRSVDAVSVLRDGSGLAVLLKDGDSVVVPRNENRILVVGAVTRPGSYAVAEDRAINIGDALGLAGGTQPGSRAKKIVLLRSTPQGVQRREFKIDQAGGGQMAFVEIVRKDDVIYVPEGTASPTTLGLVAAFLPSVIRFVP